MNIKAVFAILPLLLMASGCYAQEDSYSSQSLRVLPNFTGSWEVDYKRSESIEDKLRYLYEITRSHYQREISRRDNNFGAIQAARAELQGLIDLGRLTQLITRPQVLTIEQSRDDIVIERQGNFALTCDFNQPEVTNSALGKEVCTWHKDQLVFQLALPGGLTVYHRLAMSPGGERINVATTVSSDNVAQRFSINRVYMPFKPGEGMYKCEFSLAKQKTCYLGDPE